VIDILLFEIAKDFVSYHIIPATLKFDRENG